VSGAPGTLGELTSRAKRSDGHATGKQSLLRLRKVRESLVVEAALAWFSRTGASLRGWPKDSPGYDLASAVIALLDVSPKNEGGEP
jgi:hypothetical protein